MFLHLLNEDQKSHFLKIASLICISDAQLLWGEKNEMEITSETDLSDITITLSKEKQRILADFFREADKVSVTDFMNEWQQPREYRDVLEKFLDHLRRLPLVVQNSIPHRQVISSSVLADICEYQENPTVTDGKIMLFELLLLCQTGGEISATEKTIKEEFINHHEIDDFIVDDLTERAESINRETIRTLALILE